MVVVNGLLRFQAPLVRFGFPTKKSYFVVCNVVKVDLERFDGSSSVSVFTRQATQKGSSPVCGPLSYVRFLLVILRSVSLGSPSR